MRTRLAVIDDIPEMVKIGCDFLQESAWGWTYNEDNAERTFYLSIVHPETDTLVVTDDEGKILGVCIVSFETDFQSEHVGDIIEFYITKEGRGNGAGRALVQAACDWFDKNKCVNVFVKSTANIGQGKAFENLFSKYGFKIFSTVLVR